MTNDDKSPDKNRHLLSGANTGPIGNRLKWLRGKIPRKALALRLGVDPTTIVNYETGRRAPSLDFIAQICDLYSVTSDWLIWGRLPVYIPSSALEEIVPGYTPPPQLTAAEKTAETSNDNAKTTENQALDLSADEFEGLWLEFWREKEARRGWLQIEVIKRFPEFVEWLARRPVPLNPAQIVSLKKAEPTFHYGPPDQLDDD